MPIRLRKDGLPIVEKDEISTIFNNLDDPKYEPTMKDILKIIRETHKTINFLADKFDDISKKVTEIERQNKQITDENSEIKIRLKQLEIQHYREQQQQLNKHLTIHGVPKKSNENLEDIIINLAKITKTDISKSNIISCRRMNANENTNAPIIVAEFDNIHNKQQLHNNFKINGAIIVKQLFTNTTNDSKKIYINEYLSEYTRKLLEDTKKLKVKHNIQFVWVKNGVVYLRVNATSNVFKIIHQDNIKETAGQLQNQRS